MTDTQVLVEMPDGSWVCGLGVPSAPASDGSALTGMTGLVTLLEARLEDLIALSHPGGGVGAGGTDEVQVVSIVGSPGSGRFTLALDGAVTDPPIPYHPAAGDLQRALEALPTIGDGNVLVSKDSNWVYVIGFQAALGNRDVSTLVADASQLGGGATIDVSVRTEGGASTGPVTATTSADESGGLLITLTDSTRSWIYRVVPAVKRGTTRLVFLGQLTS